MLSEIEQNISLAFNSIIDSNAALMKILSSSEILVVELKTERAVKIQDIKRRIASGTYKVSSLDVAQALIMKV